MTLASLWLAIFGMGILTLSLRSSFLILPDRVQLPPLLRRALRYVPAAVLTHVDGCRSCTTHLGNAALLSLHTGREIAMVAREEDASARAPMPRLFIALGLAFAVLGLVPSFVDAPSEVGSAKAFAHDVPMFVNGLGTLGRRLLEPGSPTGLALTYGAAAMLVVMGFALVRLLPKKEVSR